FLLLVCFVFVCRQSKAAALIIERAWMSARDRTFFNMLKHSICAAEKCFSTVFLHIISPLEAELIQDPTMAASVRLRFGGSAFPPLVYFKIFHHQSGPVVKYFSGKTMLNSTTVKANEDCLRMKGHRVFLEHMVNDGMQHFQKDTTDMVDIVTLKDYIHYLSYLDETPAKYGGKCNYWRLLSREDVPRHIVFYDILEYLYSGKISAHVRRNMAQLLIKPQTSKIQLLHLKIISALKSTLPSAMEHTMRSARVLSKKETKRRSSRAVKKVSKMKELYDEEKKRQSVVSSSCRNGIYPPENTVIHTDSSAEMSFSSETADLESNSDEDNPDLDNEAQMLYEWTKHLSIDNVMANSEIYLSP
ncbi:putative uncharacterized protein CXorf58 isoform X1, partial [Argonauta hians]